MLRRLLKNYQAFKKGYEDQIKTVVLEQKRMEKEYKKQEKEYNQMSKRIRKRFND